MSLKGFHLVFVTISTLLCVFLALWAFVFAPEKSGLATTMGVIGVAGILLIPAYGVYFYRKITRNHL